MGGGLKRDIPQISSETPTILLVALHINPSHNRYIRNKFHIDYYETKMPTVGLWLDLGI